MNPSGLLYHVWATLLTVGFLYNAVAIWLPIFREFRHDFSAHWLWLNAASDALNLLDLAVQAKKAFLDRGLLVTNWRLTTRRYVFSLSFLVDLLAILPTDLLFLHWPQLLPLRLNRLAKWNRVKEFIRLTERRSPWPLGFRLLRLATFCYLLFHWNACFFFLLSMVYGYEDATVNDWTFSFQKIPDLLYPFCDTRFDVYQNACLFPERDWRERPMRLAELHAHWKKRIGSTHFGNLTKKYAMSFYWSALTLVTIGEQPWPANNVQQVFEIVDTLIGLLVFAAIIGVIGIMVSSAHLAKANFQDFADGCKHYMRIRHMNEAMRDRVINWIEYEWIWGERGANVADNHLLTLLPPSLASELLANAHLPALERSPVFSLCERALLVELANRLQQRSYGPGDIVCRRGEVAKEMFVVKLGRFEILLDEELYDDNGSSGQRSISPRLSDIPRDHSLIEGDLYGDWALISETKFPYTVRSVGYSCLCTIGREMMAIAFEDYPHSRRMVRRKANLLRQQYEQRWSSSTGPMHQSFDSEEFLFFRRRTAVSSLLTHRHSIFDEEDDDAPLLSDKPVSLEGRLREVQRTIGAITSEVEKAESRFVQNSTEMKRWISALEQEYQEQRPRLKQMLQQTRRQRQRQRHLRMAAATPKTSAIYQEASGSSSDGGHDE